MFGAKGLAIGGDHHLGARITSQQPARERDGHGERLERPRLDRDHRTWQFACIDPFEPAAHGTKIPGVGEGRLVGMDEGEGPQQEGKQARAT